MLSLPYLSLPPAIRRRIKALKRLQLATTKLEAAFFAEVQELEAKYLLQYQPWLDKVRLPGQAAYFGP